MNNGALWIGFPGEGVAFGEQLNDFPLFRDRLRAFAQLVERVEYDKGNDVLGKARQIIQEI